MNEFDTIQVKQLVLVDSDGNPRATLGVRDNGTVGLELSGADRTRHLRLEVGKDGRPVVKLLGPVNDMANTDMGNSWTQISMVINSDGTSVISLNCEDRSTVTDLVMMRDGHSYLRFSSNGKMLAEFCPPKA